MSNSLADVSFEAEMNIVPVRTEAMSECRTKTSDPCVNLTVGR